MKYDSPFSFIRAMNPALKILFLVSFVLQESVFATALDSRPEYDITTHLNEAIIKVFQSVNPNAAMKLLSHMENRGASKYEAKNAQRLPPFGNKIFFHGINISIWEPMKTPKIYCEFHKNKTRIFHDELAFKVVGFADTSPRNSYASFKTNLKFVDITVSAVESSKGLYNNQFQINFSYKRLTFNYLTLPWIRETLANNKQEKLIKKIKTIVPTMVHDNINHNEKFIHKIHSSFCHTPKQRIISAYPNFLSNEDQYYYFIPKVSFLGVDLVNIKIKGLSNFESLRPNVTFGNSAYTLIVKKVRGRMNLEDKEFEKLSNYEWKFNIDYLHITVDYETKRLVVEARDYKVLITNTKPPKESVLATDIMQNIELAISSSIMEALEVSVSNEIDQPSITPETERTPEIITEPLTITDPTTDETSSRTMKLKIASTRARNARFSGAMYEFAFKKLLESTLSSSSTAHTTENTITTKKVYVTKRRNRYDRFSDAMYEFKKSFQSSPSTNQSTKIVTTAPISKKTVTTTQISTTIATTTETPTTIATTTKASTTIATTTETPTTIATTPKITTKSTQSRTSSVTKSAQTSTSRQANTETSPKSNSRVKTTTVNAEEEPFDYDISFHNVTIKLVSGSPYPRQIQCEFFKTLKIDHQINAIPTGNIRLNNKGSAININFHANFTAIEIAVVKPGNNSNENATCEFQIYNNQDIKVILPSNKNKTVGNENLKIKSKLDRTVMSLMKERITQTVKPLVCYPFELCSQSVNVLDDFFQRIIDNVLKKCSLRRTTTS